MQSLRSNAISTSQRAIPGHKLTIHFHEKVTANNDAYAGIHPLVALHSHQISLAPLVERALACLHRKPDLICATRGPGMRSNLSVGLDTAKGLALGFNVPFIGIHHMQAHALTPRLVHAMANAARSDPPVGMGVEYPFLTMLVSGGHSMLLNSKNGVEHTNLAQTQDIALGDCIDKAARAILHPEMLQTPYGRALEEFAFPAGMQDYDYMPPKGRQDELRRHKTKWNWSLSPPLADSNATKSSRRMIYSFAGLLSSVERFMRYECDADGHLYRDRPRSPDTITLDERREMAREVQRVAFEHLASRVLLYLTNLEAADPSGTLPNTLVVSGGVASNNYLRHVLRSILDARGYSHIALNFPPVELCTDNALMIAWAGYEMFTSGYTSQMDIGPLRKWSMDPQAEDGGILGVGGYHPRDPAKLGSNLLECS